MINLIINTFSTSLSTSCLGSDVCDLSGIPTASASSSQLNNILSIVLGIVGAITVLIIIIGAIQIISSDGNPEKFARGKRVIIYALVGLVVIVSAETLVGFVLGSIKL